MVELLLLREYFLEPDTKEFDTRKKRMVTDYNFEVFSKKGNPENLQRYHDISHLGCYWVKRRRSLRRAEQAQPRTEAAKARAG